MTQVLLLKLSTDHKLFSSFIYLFENCLVSDPITEHVDVHATVKKTIEFYKTLNDDEKKLLLKKHRLVLVNYLSNLYYGRVDVTDEFLMSNEYRIQKMCAISEALERLNLESFKGFKGNPKKEDIPSWLTGVYELLESKEKIFKILMDGYVKRVESVKQLKWYYCDKSQI